MVKKTIDDLLLNWSDPLGLYKLPTRTVDNFKSDLLDFFVKEMEGQYELVDRLEVIDDTGRAYVKGSIYGSPVKIKLSLQDDNRTLKIFVDKREEQ